MVLKNRLLFLVGLTLVFIFVHILAALAVEWDRSHWKLIGYYPQWMPLIIGVISAGLFCLGYYYFYSVVLLHHRQTQKIFTTTAVAAAVNVVATIWLVYELGPLGAAWGTLLSYLVYLLITVRAACRVEPRLKENRLIEMAPLILGISGILLPSYLWQYSWAP